MRRGTGDRMSQFDTLTPEQVRRALAQYEAEFGMDSAAFYQRYLTADAGSTDREMKWAALFEAAMSRNIVPPPDLESTVPRPAHPAGTAIVRLTPEQLRVELSYREATYGLSSAEFHERFLAGTAGDEPWALEWEFLCDLGVEAGLLPLPGRVHI